MTPRITRHEYFATVAIVTSHRSSCLKKQVGVILVKEGRIIATGYNGVLKGVSPKKGIDKEGITHTVHAEINVIAFCAKHGIPTDNCIMYTTLSPCEKCAEAIIQAGIKKVYYVEKYRDPSGIELLNSHGVETSITI